ncbi:MAG: RnfABCDGE type electron transport complex subunit G [Endomicrobiia bacterium]
MNNKFILKIFDIGFRLTLLCVVSAILLSWVYKKTKLKIEENIKKEIELSQREVLSDAITFQEKETDGIKYIEGYDNNGTLVGKIFTLSKRGYGSEIKMMIGVKNGKIIGVKIIQHGETPGLGDGVTKKNFLNQFINKTIDQLSLKKDGGEIDGITGATISSKTCIKIAKEALEYARKQQ